MDNIELVLMYDYYNLLLEDKEKIWFEYYYFDNMSLQEISENYGVSRNAVHKSLKKVKEKLIDYENKLHLIEKSNKLKKIIEEISDEETKNKLIDIDL